MPSSGFNMYTQAHIHFHIHMCVHSYRQIPIQQITLRRSLSKKFIDMPAMQSLWHQHHLMIYEMTLPQHPEESLFIQCVQ